MNELHATTDFGAIREALRRRMVPVILVLVVVPAALVIFSLVTPKIYRATVVVAPATFGPGLGGVDAPWGPLGDIAALAGLSGDKSSAKDEAIAVLRSRTFTERFLLSSGAMNEIMRFRFGSDETERYKVYRYFDSSVRRVSENRRTGLYTIAIEWIDPEIAARWANSLVEMLNSEMRSRAVNEAERNLKYLNSEIDNAEQIAIRDAVSRLVEAQIKQRMFASVTSEYVFRVIDPAVPPSARDHVYPNRLLFALGGFLLAVFLAAGIVIANLRSRRDTRTAA